VTRFVLRRLGALVVSVWGGVTIVFFIVRVTGNPARLMLPAQASPAQVAALSRTLGLERPLVVQYWHFVAGLLQGSWGNSLFYNEPALRVVMQYAPATVELTTAAMAIAVILGVPIGLISAARRGSVADGMLRVTTMTAQGLPVFWVGMMLIFLFAVRLHVLPPSGRSGLSSLVLPAVSLAVYPMAAVARLTRSSVSDILREEYIATANLKGLAPIRVVGRHALRNAVAPILNIVGLQVGTLLGGAVVTETVFSWPGLGQLTIQAIQNRDFPLVQVIVIVAIIVVSVTNLLVDILHAVADPRVRYAQ
jgi:peptide/nickel transport system permease protein